MAITIRNKETEELIKRIGKRTGEGPSAVVRRLARADSVVNDSFGVVPPDLVKARITRLRQLRDEYRQKDDPNVSWQRVEQEMDSIFGDELGSMP